MSAETVINTNGLRKSYNGLEALKPLDLQVRKNSIFGFLGPNGAGKTTTLKLLLGLTHPTGGSGTIFGYDIVRDSVEIRKRVGYLAQEPRFYDYMTARETLHYAAHFFYAGPKDAIEKRITEVLELVGLADRADRPIRGFSGGERQRLGIAQAQVNEPDLLILDEPAAALDPMGRRDVLDIMAGLREHATIFYSTHILDDVQRVSDSVAILNRGQLVAQAPIEELLAGADALSYSLTLKGAAARETYDRVVAQPWVSDVQQVAENGLTHWQVSVTDEEAAEAHLLRLILCQEPALTVVEFSRRRYNLEEVFMEIVASDNEGAHT